MKLYDGYLISEYVKEGDYPEIGEVFVCLDIQNRLGPQTWLVAVMGDGTCQADTTQLGLFWKQGLAINMALLYESVLCHDPRYKV